MSDPAAFFRAAATLLAPGGELLVTFPNEPAHAMHGITRFDTPADLSKIIDAAGFASHRIGAARLSAGTKPLADALGFRAIDLVRKVLRRKKKPGANGGGEKKNGGSAAASSPQTFDETHFFKAMNTWRRLSPALNVYWFGVLRLMEARGPAFDVDWDCAKQPFTHCQVLVLARK